MKINRTAGYMLTGLLALNAGCSCNQNTRLDDEQHNATTTYIHSQKDRITERKKQDLEIEKSKPNWEKQKLEGRVLTFENSNQTFDFKYPLRDLIRNYDGWSITYVDSDTKEVKEYRLFNQGSMSVKVLEDLSATDEHYLEIRQYYSTFVSGTGYNATIHISPETKLSFGDDFQKTSPKTNQGVYHKRTLVR